MSKKGVFCQVTILVFLLSGSAFSQAVRTTDPFAGFSEKVEYWMSKWQIPGLAIGVVKGGEAIYRQGFGYRDLEKRLPVTAKTVFGIGSIAKTFTAMSVAMLVDEKKLEWDTPVIGYLPDFKLYDDYATLHATARDLLCHRTGMAEHLLMTYGSPFSREEVYRRLRYLEPNSGFRQKYQYNNLMYLTAGYLVGRVCGETWEDFVEKRIFGPLEMAASRFSLEIQNEDDYSLPYMFSDGKLAALPFRNRDSSAPSGGINSNVEDLIKWLRLHLNQGKIGKKELVSAKSLKELLTPQMPVHFSPESVFGPVQDYGMGWNIQPYLGHHLNHVGGWIEGFVSWISFAPFDDTGIVILCNMSDCMLPYFLHYVIYDRLFGLGTDKWDKILDHYKPQYLDQSSAINKKPDPQPVALPLPPEKYEGIYDHPGYGSIVIGVENGNLYALFRGERIRLIHMRDNFFFTEHILDSFDRKGLRFIRSDQGGIERLEMALQRGVKNIAFLRQ